MLGTVDVTSEQRTERSIRRPLEPYPGEWIDRPAPDEEMNEASSHEPRRERGDGLEAARQRDDEDGDIDFDFDEIDEGSDLGEDVDDDEEDDDDDDEMDFDADGGADFAEDAD